MPNVYSLDSLLVAVSGTALVVGSLCIHLARGPQRLRANQRTRSQTSPLTMFPDDAWRATSDGWLTSTRVVATARVRRRSRVDVLDLPVSDDLYAPAALYEQIVSERGTPHVGQRP
jgi:hypothetical protein